eukprot:12101398-Alexandrium_andersonii.AAC.1
MAASPKSVLPSGPPSCSFAAVKSYTAAPRSILSCAGGELGCLPSRAGPQSHAASLCTVRVDTPRRRP